MKCASPRSNKMATPCNTSKSKTIKSASPRSNKMAGPWNKQNYESCLAAAQQNGRASKKQNDERCLAAVQQDGRALEYVIREQDHELCMPRRERANPRNIAAFKHDDLR